MLVEGDMPLQLSRNYQIMLHRGWTSLPLAMEGSTVSPQKFLVLLFVLCSEGDRQVETSSRPLPRPCRPLVLIPKKHLGLAPSHWHPLQNHKMEEGGEASSSRAQLTPGHAPYAWTQPAACSGFGQQERVSTFLKPPPSWTLPDFPTELQDIVYLSWAPVPLVLFYSVSSCNVSPT